MPKAIRRRIISTAVTPLTRITPSRCAAAIDPLGGVPRTGTLHIPAHHIPEPGPGAYALQLKGDCLEPETFDGDMAVASPAAPLKSGKFVIIWLKVGTPLIRRLIVPPLSFDVDVVTGEVVPAVIVEMLNPRKSLVITMDRVKALHAVVGVLRPEQYEPMRQQRPAALPAEG